MRAQSAESDWQKYQKRYKLRRYDEYKKHTKTSKSRCPALDWPAYLHEILALLTCEVDQGVQGELKARRYPNEARRLVLYLAKPRKLHR